MSLTDPSDPEVVKVVRARIHLGEDAMLSSRTRTRTGRDRWAREAFPQRRFHAHAGKLPQLRRSRFWD